MHVTPRLVALPSAVTMVPCAIVADMLNAPPHRSLSIHMPELTRPCAIVEIPILLRCTSLLCSAMALLVPMLSEPVVDRVMTTLLFLSRSPLRLLSVDCSATTLLSVFVELLGMTTSRTALFVLFVLTLLSLSCRLSECLMCLLPLS